MPARFWKVYGAVVGAVVSVVVAATGVSWLTHAAIEALGVPPKSGMIVVIVFEALVVAAVVVYLITKDIEPGD